MPGFNASRFDARLDPLAPAARGSGFIQRLIDAFWNPPSKQAEAFEGEMLRLQAALLASEERVRHLREDVSALESIREQLRQTQDQLRQAQKMEVVGRLTGGLVHDFNNMLTVISGQTELAIRDVGESARQRLEGVRKAVDHAGALTRQLLLFSRKPARQPQTISLNSIVMDMETLLRRLVGEDVKIIAFLGSGVGTVLADPGQIEQIIMNLAINARDAMPKGGRLLIETGTVDFVSAAARTAGARPVAHTLLRIRDNGVGMDPETQARVFEPFFTTKEEGKGTGLGLAIVHDLVHQAGGSIELMSAPGEGTTFSLYFPRVDCRAELSGAAAPLPHPEHNGSGTVLLVEDDTEVRRLAYEILTDGGYSVLDASSGEDALEVAARHEGAIDLVMTDLVMPGMNGRAMVEQLLVPRPSLRVLYVSGYPEMLVEDLLGARAEYLAKPFSPRSLLANVHELLHAAAPRPRGDAAAPSAEVQA
jgi:two-component system cell cycle sensor histidine kinase/response regulator CckA